MSHETQRLGSALGQDIECAELDFLVVLAGVQGVEVGDAVDAEDDGLAGLTLRAASTIHG